MFDCISNMMACKKKISIGNKKKKRRPKTISNARTQFELIEFLTLFK